MTTSPKKRASRSEWRKAYKALMRLSNSHMRDYRRIGLAADFTASDTFSEAADIVARFGKLKGSK